MQGPRRPDEPGLGPDSQQPPLSAIRSATATSTFNTLLRVRSRKASRPGPPGRTRDHSCEAWGILVLLASTWRLRPRISSICPIG